MQNLLIANAKTLQTKASQLAQVTQLAKLGGGASLVSGALLTLVSGGVGAVPLVIGGGVYLAAAGREFGTTGHLTPLPWAKIDLLKAFNAHRGGGGEGTVKVADYQHLSDDDKATYCLCTVLAPVTQALCEGKSEDEQAVIATALKESLLRHHRSYPLQVGDGLTVDVNLLDDPHNAIRRVFGSPSGFIDTYTKTLPYELNQALPKALRGTAPAPLTEDDIYEGEVVEDDVPVSTAASAEIAETLDIPSSKNSEAPGGERLVYLSKLLASKLKSTLLLGAPRSGKGYSMAHAVELLPDSVDLWGIDPKDDRSEDHYWTRFPKNQLVRFDCTELDPSAVATKCLAMFERFSEAPSSADKPKLLIIDEAAPGLSSCELNQGQAKAEELPELGNWFKKLMLKCARLASVGPSKGKFVWILSQSSTGEDLGISNGNKGGYRVCAVGHRDTAPTWFDSIARSLKIGKPSPEVLATGYIQNDGSGWYKSQPFELAPVADNKPLIVDMGAIQAEPESLNELFKKDAIYPTGLPAEEPPEKPKSPMVQKWEKTLAQMKKQGHSLLPVMEWMNNRNDYSWTWKTLEDNSKLKSTIGTDERYGDSRRKRIRKAFECLARLNLVKVDDDGVFCPFKE